MLYSDVKLRSDNVETCKLNEYEWIWMNEWMTTKARQKYNLLGGGNRGANEATDATIDL